MIGGRRMLYGDRGAPVAASGNAPRITSTSRVSPPPVGAERFADDDDPGYAEPSREPIRGSTTPRPQPARDERPAAATSSGERARSGHTIPGGPEKGVALEDAADRSLAYWEERISNSIAEGSSRFPDKDQALVDALRAEMSARDGGGR